MIIFDKKTLTNLKRELNWDPLSTNASISLVRFGLQTVIIRIASNSRIITMLAVKQEMITILVFLTCKISLKWMQLGQYNFLILLYSNLEMHFQTK
ncbi:hypothetical protein MXB_4923 [Myxobolus squamalis]|nr:hypothetical protein MXB_4923 [Myxobolus squamalis]